MGLKRNGRRRTVRHEHARGDSSVNAFETIGPTLEFANEEEWRRGRSTFIGGSDAAVLYGKGYSGQEPVKLFAEKYAGAEPSFEPAQLRRFALGKAAEPVMRSTVAVSCRARLAQ